MSNIKYDAKSVKQQKWKFYPEMQEMVETEVIKLIACEFIHEEQYPN